MTNQLNRKTGQGEYMEEEYDSTLYTTSIADESYRRYGCGK